MTPNTDDVSDPKAVTPTFFWTGRLQDLFEVCIRSSGTWLYYEILLSEGSKNVHRKLTASSLETHGY